MAHLGLPLGLWSEKVAVARVRSFYHKPGLLQREEVLGGGALGGGKGGVNLSPLGGRFGSWILFALNAFIASLQGMGWRIMNGCVAVSALFEIMSYMHADLNVIMGVVADASLFPTYLPKINHFGFHVGPPMRSVGTCGDQHNDTCAPNFFPPLRGGRSRPRGQACLPLLFTKTHSTTLTSLSLLPCTLSSPLPQTCPIGSCPRCFGAAELLGCAVVTGSREHVAHRWLACPAAQRSVIFAAMRIPGDRRGFATF